MKTEKIDPEIDIEFIICWDDIILRNRFILKLNDQIDTTFGRSWTTLFLFSVRLKISVHYELKIGRQK